MEAMRTRLYRWIIGLCSLAQGCSPLADDTRSLIIEPIQYCEPLDDLIASSRSRTFANSAWVELKQNHPEQDYSPDYETGFKSGFAHYLYAGGTGGLPPVPPRPYWRSRYQTPEGYLAVQDWFAGFRHGAAAAQESGYRQWMTVPFSLLGPPLPHPEPLPATPDAATEPTLPMPKRAMPSAPAEGENIKSPQTSRSQDASP